MGNMFGMFLFPFWVIRTLKCEAVHFLKFESASIPIRPFKNLSTVEILQFSFFDLLSPEVYNSLGSFVVFPEVACSHVSFTAYENFYKLSKMHCLLILFSTFFPSEVSENRNFTIKHISTYTLFCPSISTYVVDHFLVISCQ